MTHEQKISALKRLKNELAKSQSKLDLIQDDQKEIDKLITEIYYDIEQIKIKIQGRAKP